MGLFSFIKNAGAKIFGKKEEEAPEVKQVKLSKIDALKAEVAKHNLQIQDLGLELTEALVVTGKTMTNAEREKVILAVGNIDGICVVEDQIEVTNPEPEATFHVVQKGDTLSKISKEVYGDAMKYPVIFEANKPMLKDVNLIYPGQTLRIPQL